MQIITLVRLMPIKVYDHLIPMLMRDEVSQMTLVRYAELPFDDPKISQVAYGDETAREIKNPIMRGLQTLLNPLRLFALAWRTAKASQADVIYGINGHTNGLMALIIAKRLGKKSLVSFIGTDLNKWTLEWITAPLMLFCIRRMDAVTVFDNTAREKLIKRGIAAEKIFVMPHAIRAEKFLRREGLPQDIDAVFTGMFVPLKEIGKLVSAWRLVVDQKPYAKLALVGDGILREALEEQVKQLGLSKNVIFTGWVDDVVDTLSRAKIFINLSNQEGVPHAMLEAMACDLVPIVTDVGGVPSVIRDGVNGFLIPNPADPALVAKRILAVMDNDLLFASLHERALKIRRDNSYEAVSAAWGAVFDYLKAED